MEYRMTQYLLENAASILKPLSFGVYRYRVRRKAGAEVETHDHRHGALLLVRILCAQKYKPCPQFSAAVYGNTLHITYRGMQACWFFDSMASLNEAMQAVQERIQ